MRVEVGVVKVLFDSLICCVLPSSLLLCLDSSAASELLFRFGAHGSARQPESKVFWVFLVEKIKDHHRRKEHQDSSSVDWL